MDETFAEAIKTVIPFEERLSIKKGFYIGLLIEKDDWSFVIKLHALIEAALSHLLAEIITLSVKEYLPEEKQPTGLEEVFSWLELSNKRTGKLAFVKALDIFPEEHRRFIRALSELRNDLVHNVKNINFSFSQYLSSLDTNQVNKFTQAFSYGLRDRLILNEKEVPREEWIKEEPKWAVWFSGLYCMSEIAGCLGYVTQSKSLADLKDELFDKQQQFITVMNEKLRSEKPRPEGAVSSQIAQAKTDE